MSQLRNDLKYFKRRFRRWHAYALPVLVALATASLFGATIGLPKALIVVLGTIVPFLFFGILISLT